MRNRLTIQSEIFAALTEDFNNMLELTLNNMLAKQQNEGEITVKLNIALQKGCIPTVDYDGVTETRDILLPKFFHKISSTMKFEEKKSGKCTDGYELRFNDLTGEYETIKIDNGQVEIFV